MPLYSSHLLAYEGLKLGQRIRDVRQRRSLTLKGLATRVATSPARLSQIENERLRLTLQDLLKFAHALEIPLDALLHPDVTLPYQITRDADRAERSPRPMAFEDPDGDAPVGSPHAYWPLAALFVGRHLEPVLGRMAPVDERHLQFCYHHEEEFVFALKGGLEFRIQTPEGERREELDRGDCVYFRSDLLHAFRSLERDPIETLHVFRPPAVAAQGGRDAAATGAFASGRRDTPRDLQRQVADRLRMMREMHGWSLERVARSTGLPERQISRMERGDRAVPVEALLKLARVFGQPLRALVGRHDPQAPCYVVQRSSAIPSIPSRRRRTPVERPSAPPSKTCQPLVAGFPTQEMYPYLVRLLNVDIETLTLHEHHGQEFIYVLEGELELTTYAGTRQVREVLRAGDSCYLDSTVPHLLRSWTRNPYSETSAEVIDVFWCPLGEEYLFES